MSLPCLRLCSLNDHYIIGPSSRRPLSGSVHSMFIISSDHRLVALSPVLFIQCSLYHRTIVSSPCLWLCSFNIHYIIGPSSRRPVSGYVHSMFIISSDHRLVALSLAMFIQCSLYHRTIVSSPCLRLCSFNVYYIIGPSCRHPVSGSVHSMFIISSDHRLVTLSPALFIHCLLYHRTFVSSPCLLLCSFNVYFIIGPSSRHPVSGSVHSLFIISSDLRVVTLSPALFIQCLLYHRTIVSSPCLRLCSFIVHYIIGPSCRQPVSCSVHSMFIISSDHRLVTLSPALFIHCSLYHRTFVSSPCLRLCSFIVHYIIGPSCRHPVSGSVHSLFIISSDHRVVTLSPALFIQCLLYHRTIVSSPCLRLCSFIVHYIIGPSCRHPVSCSVHSMFIISSDHRLVTLSPALFIHCSLYHRTFVSSPCLLLCSFNVYYIIGPSSRHPVSGSVHSLFIISSDLRVVTLSPALFIQCLLYHRTIVSSPCLRLCSFIVRYIIGPSCRHPVSCSVHSMFIISSDHRLVTLSPALFIHCSLYHRTIVSSTCLLLCSFNVYYIIGPSSRHPVSGSVHSLFIISSDHRVVTLSPALFPGMCCHQLFWWSAGYLFSLPKSLVHLHFVFMIYVIISRTFVLLLVTSRLHTAVISTLCIIRNNETQSS